MTEPVRASRRGRRAAVVIALGLLVLGAVVARLFVWPPTSTPHRVDAVVVLGGGEPTRTTIGLNLFADGVADELVLSAGARLHAAEHGVACGGYVHCITPAPSTTAGEAAAVSRLAREYGWSSLAVVTSTYHLTRARVLFGQCFDGELAMVEAPVPRAGTGFRDDVLREAPDLVAGLTFARAC